MEIASLIDKGGPVMWVLLGYAGMVGQYRSAVGFVRYHLIKVFQVIEQAGGKVDATVTTGEGLDTVTEQPERP